MNSLNQTEQTTPEEQTPNQETITSLQDTNAVLEELIKTKLPPSLNRE